MDKVYLISVVTALSLGIGGTVLTESLTAQAGKTISHHVSIEKTLGETAKNTFESFLTNQLCSKVENEFSLNVGDCNADQFKKSGVHFYFGEIGNGQKGWIATSNIEIEGTWVAGQPK